LVTTDEAGSHADIRIRTWVNDELRQDAYAGEMATDPCRLIEWLSATTTLQPGDIVTTGTPAGVIMGSTRPTWLADGDTVRIELTGLGTMSTPVRDE
jgi:2-keto-4-pentenoate hydratase/2-oxohepta-3-ene-1,7-dioic acid hydratase in catechol pathway